MASTREIICTLALKYSSPLTLKTGGINRILSPPDRTQKEGVTGVQMRVWEREIEREKRGRENAGEHPPSLPIFLRHP